MSEWNYTKCAKPFDSAQSAKEYLLAKDFAGHILQRENGYSAVCPTYPEGYYPDAVLVESVENSLGELGTESPATTSTCCS
jgi:hypothetical protein